MAIAIAAAVASCVLGAYASYHLDVSTGGAIVVIQTALFLLVVALAPRGGLLSELWRRWRRAGGGRPGTGPTHKRSRLDSARSPSAVGPLASDTPRGVGRDRRVEPRANQDGHRVQVDA